MNPIKFPEVNSKGENNTPIALVNYSSPEGAKTLHVISKFSFNKAEIRFIREHKHIWVVQNLGEKIPMFAFKNPFTSTGTPFKVLNFEAFIHHTFTWQDHNFMVLLSRDYNNNKARVRWFSITMDGDWVKSGNLPESLQRDGSGWLKQVLVKMVEEYEDIMGNRS